MSNTNRNLRSFQRVLETYISAVRGKNADEFLAIYNGDLYVFDAWDSWSVRGIDAWRKMVDAWFTSLGSEYVVVTADDVNSNETEDTIAGHAILTYTAFSAEGEKLRSLSNRMTAALRMTNTGLENISRTYVGPDRSSVNKSDFESSGLTSIFQGE